MGDANQEERKDRKRLDDDDLVIEDTTIYEVDLDCYECLRREKKKLENRKNNQ